MRSFILLLTILLPILLLAQEEVILSEVDEPATFPYDRQKCEGFIETCANEAMEAYLSEAMRYDSSMGTGSVSLLFVVEKDGSITNPRITQSLNATADAEAIRLINTMNQLSQKWRAAWHGNGFVRSYGEASITFKKPTRNTKKEATIVNQPLAPPPVNNLKPILPEEIDPLFTLVDRMPMFPFEDPGYLSKEEKSKMADKALLEFVYGNLIYPQDAKLEGHEGLGVVTFIVEADGTMSNIRVVRNPGGASLEQEMLRVMNKMNDEIRWIPAVSGDQNVRVRFNLPIKWKIRK